MAQYEHLPIYRKAFDLAVHMEQVVHGFSRHHKYGIGVRLQHATVALLERVIRAQNTDGQTRTANLSELRIEGEVVKNLLHLAREVNAFKSSGAFNKATGLAVDIGRQTEGWLKHTRTQCLPESRPTNPKGGRS